jgi:hypothetical protein
MADRITASIWLLHFFDAAEEFDLPKAAQPGPVLRPPARAYLGSERPPVTGALDSTGWAQRHGARTWWKAFEFGVLEIALEIPFSGTWDELVQTSARILEDPAADAHVATVARHAFSKVESGARSAYPEWLTEDYLVVHLTSEVPASQLLKEHGNAIAQLVRGETQALSASEQQEVLSSTLSCYPHDLLVAGWAAAFVYEPVTTAPGTIQLLEYANTQLLEFRHYDEVLKNLLARLYQLMAERAGTWRRWRMAREVQSINALRLEVAELAERSEHSLRFLGDMYFARAYRVAAQRIGVADFRALVDDKVRTAGELYRFLVDEFQHQRAFVLELMVVLILIIELAYTTSKILTGK